MIIDLYNGDAMYENISCTITTRYDAGVQNQESIGCMIMEVDKE